MDEGRKRVLLVAASILAARRLSHWDGGVMKPPEVSAIADAVHIAHKIMQGIDADFPETKKPAWRDDLREKDQRH